MISFSILASGSAANASMLSTDTTRVLVDCGLSVKELNKRLAENCGGTSSWCVDAVVLSHEHGDHCSGLARFVKNGIRRGHAVPVYCTELTAAQIDWEGLECPPVHIIQPGTPFVIGDILVDPFTVSHDSADPINFVFMAPGATIGFSTDLGFVPPAMIRKFADCQIIVLESNHDVEMLAACDRPPDTIARIAGEMGHLSNDQAMEFLSTISPTVQTVVLCHLSEGNNSREKAEWAAKKGLLMAASSARLMIASQDEVTRII
jgi:phosphoribosyl 1,2-cyclic phosphodiesterase